MCTPRKLSGLLVLLFGLFLFTLALPHFTGVALLAQDEAGAPTPITIAQPADAADAAEEPARVPLRGARQISMGYHGACMVSETNDLYCWGLGSSGENGDGTNSNRRMPIKVQAFDRSALKVSRATFHTCALRDDGTVWCWGSNAHGQLGIGTDDDSNVPVQVKGITNAVDVETGGNTSCALLADGTMKCWGDNQYEQVGNSLAPTLTLEPYFVSGLTDVVDMAVGLYHTCAVQQSGTAHCWGANVAGQLGTGNQDPQALPAQVVTFTDFKVIAAGDIHTCGLRANGSMHCWGDNAFGQLGNNALVDSANPVPVNSLQADVVDIDASGLNSCAITFDRALRCWGFNENWGIGDGSLVNSSIPVLVANLNNSATSFSHGSNGACAALLDTTVKCWGGGNEYGQMGNGTLAYNTIPAFVMIPAVCYELTLLASSGGSVPTADIPRSDGCPLNHYVRDTMVNLHARPASSLFRVSTWTPLVAGAPGTNLGVLRIPAADVTVTVTYAACHLLNRTHAGNGGNPVPSFNNSLGCPSGRYAAGEIVQLAAAPAPDQRVKAWAGAAITPGEALQVNSITVPNMEVTVHVDYEACHQLQLLVIGEGDFPGVFPAASAGCAAGTIVAGENIHFTASPAAGWQVGAWHGTQQDASTSLENGLVMPAANHAVTVNYVLTQSTVLLPVVSR